MLNLCPDHLTAAIAKATAPENLLNKRFELDTSRLDMAGIDAHIPCKECFTQDWPVAVAANVSQYADLAGYRYSQLQVRYYESLTLQAELVRVRAQSQAWKDRFERVTRRLEEVAASA